jgi:hypothetical protein
VFSPVTSYVQTLVTKPSHYAYHELALTPKELIHKEGAKLHAKLEEVSNECLELRNQECFESCLPSV